MRSRIDFLMRKCCPSFWRGKPRSAFDHDAAHADNEPAGSRLQELGGRGKGRKQQDIADLAAHEQIEVVDVAEALQYRLER